jgi:hypothetical protein
VGVSEHDAKGWSARIESATEITEHTEEKWEPLMNAHGNRWSAASRSRAEAKNSFRSLYLGH